MAGSALGLIPTEVEKLTALIRTTRANGVVLLSGDRHTGGGIYKMPKAGGGESGAPYDVCKSASSSLSHSFRTEEAELATLRVAPLTR